MCALDGCHGGAAVLQNVRFGAGVPFSCHRLLVLSGAVAGLMLARGTPAEGEEVRATLLFQLSLGAPTRAESKAVASEGSDGWLLKSRCP